MCSAERKFFYSCCHCVCVREGLRVSFCLLSWFISSLNFKLSSIINSWKVMNLVHTFCCHRRQPKEKKSIGEREKKRTGWAEFQLSCAFCLLLFFDFASLPILCVCVVRVWACGCDKIYFVHTNLSPLNSNFRCDCCNSKHRNTL